MAPAQPATGGHSHTLAAPAAPPPGLAVDDLFGAMSSTPPTAADPFGSMTTAPPPTAMPAFTNDPFSLLAGAPPTSAQVWKCISGDALFCPHAFRLMLVHGHCCAQAAAPAATPAFRPPLDDFFAAPAVTTLSPVNPNPLPYGRCLFRGLRQTYAHACLKILVLPGPLPCGSATSLPTLSLVPPLFLFTGRFIIPTLAACVHRCWHAGAFRISTGAGSSRRRQAHEWRASS
jgi:hypothetical protein